MSAARLFFALWPGTAVRRVLQASCQALVAACDGVRVPPENYHLTLAFLGRRPLAELPAIRAAAAQVTIPSLTIELGQVGYFPESRVVWLGPARHSPVLSGLFEDLWQALTPIGCQAPARPFHPHLSLVRKTSRPPAEIGVPAVSWPVRGFVLMRSMTTSTGTEYLVDQGFPSGSSNEP